jgi:hypothetical protein
VLSRCPFLWGPSFAYSKWLVWILSGFWSFEWVSLLLPIFAYICSYGGVDNALIKEEIANTRLTCPMWFGLMMSDCQRVQLWGSQWTDQSVRLCFCNHVGRFVVCMCGAQGRWSMAVVKVMQAHADEPGLVKGNSWVTSRGGWHLGHAIARGCGGVDRVADVVDDWRDTRVVVEDVHEVWYSQWVWWFGPQNHPALRMVGFAKFGPQNSTTVVLEGTGGGTWHDREACVKATQLRVKDVAVGSKTLELVHFSPGGVDRLYVNRGNLGRENNPL